MCYLTPLYHDMVEIMKACSVKEPPRRDIIWEYTEYLHEIICDIITKFWDRNYEHIEVQIVYNNRVLIYYDWQLGYTPTRKKSRNITPTSE
jgi:hypothetical protein